MKILFLIGALLSALLLTLPPFLYQSLNTPHPSDDVPTGQAVLSADTAASAEPEQTEEAVADTAVMSDLTPSPQTSAPQETTECASVTAEDTVPAGTAADTAAEDTAPIMETHAQSRAVSAPPDGANKPDAPAITAPPGIHAGYDNRTGITVQREDGSQYTVSLRTYLIGVVMAEMPSYFHKEALRAQAVAARSYLLYRIGHGYAVCDWGSSCTAHFSEEEGMEFFGDSYHAVKEIVTAAVDDTDGQVMYYDGQVCCTAYHAMSYACTEDAALVWGGDTPYLVSVPTPEDESLAGMTTEATFDETSLCRLLGVADALPMTVTYTDAGRLSAVTAASGEVIDGERFRALLRLRSAAVTVLMQNEDTLQLRVRGFGHGVGMSQYGADLYADAGWTYEEILVHYYPAAVLGLMP